MSNDKKNENNNGINEHFSDLSKIRVNQDFHNVSGVKKITTTVSVRKPNKTEFFRIHPAEEMRITLPMIEIQSERDREEFYVLPDVALHLPGHVHLKLLMIAINRQNVVFLWPLKLNTEGGTFRRNLWNETAHTAAKLATEGWIKIMANMSLGAYDIYQASAAIPDPEWPADLDLRKYLTIAFKDRIITNMDHPVVRQLLGAE